jgi:iron-sulfur cluster repair protein YtfE (RIC family)
MAHTCKCGSRSRSSGFAVTAERTVADISHHLPGAAEVLASKGINHCCGAHLTLGEAAASAGVSLESLLDALRALEREPA